MSAYKQILDQVLRGTADAGVRFAELCGLLKKLGFDERIKEAIISLRLTALKRSSICSPKEAKQSLIRLGRFGTFC